MTSEVANAFDSVNGKLQTLFLRLDRLEKRLIAEVEKVEALAKRVEELEAERKQ